MGGRTHTSPRSPWAPPAARVRARAVPHRPRRRAGAADAPDGSHGPQGLCPRALGTRRRRRRRRLRCPRTSRVRGRRRRTSARAAQMPTAVRRHPTHPRAPLHTCGRARARPSAWCTSCWCRVCTTSCHAFARLRCVPDTSFCPTRVPLTWRLGARGLRAGRWQAYTIAKMAVTDWPHNWPELFPILLEHLHSRAPDRVHGAMRCLAGVPSIACRCHRARVSPLGGWAARLEPRRAHACALVCVCGGGGNQRTACAELSSGFTDQHIALVVPALFPQLLEVLQEAETYPPPVRARAVYVFRNCLEVVDMIREEAPDVAEALLAPALPDWLASFARVLSHGGGTAVAVQVAVLEVRCPASPKEKHSWSARLPVHRAAHPSPGCSGCGRRPFRPPPRPTQTLAYVVRAFPKHITPYAASLLGPVGARLAASKDRYAVPGGLRGRRRGERGPTLSPNFFRDAALH